MKLRPEDERLRAPEPPEQLRTPAPSSSGGVKQTKQQIIRLMKDGALQTAFPGTGGLSHYTPHLLSAGCSAEAPETATRNTKGMAGHDRCSRATWGRPGWDKQLSPLLSEEPLLVSTATAHLLRHVPSQEL